MTEDRRLAAFLTEPTEVFHSVEHRHAIWRDDPFDVETVHESARAVFDRMLTRATTPAGAGQAIVPGRILLLLGESGCGKTHLMRAFRNRVHSSGLGFVGYLTMTTDTLNYGKYILSNLIDSLDKPYYEILSVTSGLMRISNALASWCTEVGQSFLPEDGELGFEELAAHVNDGADWIIRSPRYAETDLDLVRALLFLQSDDSRIKSRVIKYLRCEDLSDADRRVLGGLVPRRADDDPQRMVENLGQLIWSIESKSLVICLDQLEDMFNFDEAVVKFRRAMATVSDLANRVPSSIFVISCLENFFEAMKGHLSRSLLDRIENDPAPVRLDFIRNREEVELLIGRRLEFLYEVAGAKFDAQAPTYPFPPSMVDRLADQRTRDVLDECRTWREQAMASGRLPEDAAPTAVALPRAPAVPDATLDLEQAWNDFRVAPTEPVPAEDEPLASLLGWAIASAADELETGHRIAAETRDATIDVRVTAGDGRERERLLVGICNKSSRGGALTKQILKLVELAGDRTPVLVRTSDYPSDPKAQVSQQIGQLIVRGGRRTVLEDADCRTMLALRAFRKKHEGAPALVAWLPVGKPLSQLPSLREILALDALRAEAPPRPSAPVPVAPERKSAPAPIAAAPSVSELPTVGVTEGLFAAPVVLTPDELTCHAAFLGGTGSGKTTLALNLIEQLLLRGVPAILVDRKGDLAIYLSDALWTRPLDDPKLAARRDRLRATLDVALYTPGHPEGRPLAIPLVPDGLADLPAFEREQAAGYAADAIAGMVGYRHKGQDKSLRAILAQALNLLVQLAPPSGIDLQTLIEFIDLPEPSLVNAVGRLDGKLFKKLVQDLETLRLNASDLLAARGEKLDVAALLGPGAKAGAGGGAARTRLTIISTKFLGDAARVQFWVSQLLVDVLRHASRHPSKALQAVLLFDEADLYLPAVAEPATKGPMTSLLKRARSAGIAILLATQSPGDFDYKCRDTIRAWFIGRVTQPTALAKLRPMLAECKVDVASRIPSQKQGHFHLVRDGEVTPLVAYRSCLATEQLSEAEILALARTHREGAARSR